MDQYQPLRRALGGSSRCLKCQTGTTIPPTYVGDSWDCDSCEWTKEPTKKQTAALTRFLTEPNFRARFTTLT